MKITDIKEYNDATTESNETIDIHRLDNFEVRCEFMLNRKAKKILMAFGNCKGPARCRAVYKYLKLHRKQQTIMARIIAAAFGRMDLIANGVEIDITGLLCTDFYEWCWLNWKNGEGYDEYRKAKLKRIERGRTRASRHRNTKS